ncbi:hypothetical protein HLH34_08530 [Gluconacetobacter azotocaptans]|uniref:Uncharacterized protein n=1 Tax=Gluconacetobacter azotocaptans TaxID=142834 RepID=A0A7W4JSE9_9PROT|nr:hypothetical protein [Gluconacetobacter azotocaptans]MBB2190015.1 hypothetical protein [Gluconacetobacter azotocaptans]MBM9401814.1 hypothetical protein [Gluconacetobacter azotocaptans]GBQ37275.1 hypothetical protein AA13594_3455 [Gluconacetobacter azotocaptans DSM 13594]
MPPRITFLMACLGGCLLAILTALAAPPYARTAQILCLFYVAAGSFVSLWIVLRPQA